MAQVMVPARQDQTGKLFQIGGAAIGGAMGGPGGALTGASVGSQAHGLLGGNKQGAGPVGAPSAMQRRMQGETPDMALEKASVALADAPPQVQQQYGPSINQALALSRRQRGLA